MGCSASSVARGKSGLPVSGHDVASVAPCIPAPQVSGHDVASVATCSEKFTGVVALDGKIFAAPGCSGNLLEFDPATGRVRGHSVDAVCGFTMLLKFAGVTTLNGKIYAAPRASDKLLVFDPATGGVIGHTVTAVATGNDKYGGITALNGKIYAAPCDSDHLLEFDPATGRVSGHDVTAVASGPDKFSGIVALNNKVYAAPLDSDSLLEFDPATGRVRGHDVTAVAKGWSKFDGITTLFGKIYAAPNSSDKLLEFDPATGRVRGHDVTALATGHFKFLGITGYAGKIFAAPFVSKKLLEFDPTTGVVRGHDVSTVFSGDEKFSGIVGLEGKLFAGPFNSGCLLEVDVCGAVSLDSTLPIVLQNTDVVRAQKAGLDSDVHRLEQEVQAAEAALKEKRAALEELRSARQQCEEAVELRGKIDQGELCQFYFVDANRIREEKAGGGSTWTLRELKQKGWVQLITLGLSAAFSGQHTAELLTVSHRWETPECADKSGKQFEAIRDHVLTHQQIKYVWLDIWCLPQGKRDAKDKELFSATLPHINLLYLTTSVLLLLDLSYLSRFWTQFEAWLSLQSAGSQGLYHDDAGSCRASMLCIHNAPSTFTETLYSMWAEKTPEQALAILSRPDVTVTNQSDKTTQLHKIAKLNDLVRAVAKEVEGSAP